jgi:hypothetical protein
VQAGEITDLAEVTHRYKLRKKMAAPKRRQSLGRKRPRSAFENAAVQYKTGGAQKVKGLALVPAPKQKERPGIRALSLRPASSALAASTGD